jgi:peptidoglycan/xylan/chitin deacetylase (PgdA/CDA1 family)
MRNRLRVVAYHDVPDRVAFRRHLEYITRRFSVVSGSDVAASFNGRRVLPRHSLWITFDDGRPGVVSNGLPELLRLGLPATLFVCPGMLPQGARFWQTIVLDSIEQEKTIEFGSRRYSDRDLVVALKSVPDIERREFVETLRADRNEAGDRPDDAIDVEQLRVWSDAGMEVGNHTWDHPCLDRCTPAEQRRQIADAHVALTELLGGPPTLFAYPNGDWTAEAERAVADFGYELAVLFDHRLATTRSHALRISRLRLDSDADMARTRAVLSGAHPSLFGGAPAVRRAARPLATMGSQP